MQSQNVRTVADLSTRAVYTVKSCTPQCLGFIVTVVGLPGCLISAVRVDKGSTVIARWYEGEAWARHVIPTRGGR